jgi:alkylation response protein AidB-like acyl-CoA dehydrogenase
MANPQVTQAGKTGYAPPPIDGDFYRIASVLNDKERALLGRVREFTEGVVAPVIEDYWGRDEFPFAMIPEMATVGIGGGWLPRLWRGRWQLAVEQLCRDGAGPGRCISRDVLGCPYRAIGRLDLSM